MIHVIQVFEGSETKMIGLDPAELLKAAVFEHRHYYWCREPTKLDPSYHPGFTYHLHQTGIGVKIEVECRLCKEIEDISDYDSW